MLGYKVDGIDIKGSEKGEPVFFPMSHPNIMNIGMKKSGKSNLIYHLLRNIVGKNTKIYIFCSTANRDRTYIQMIKELEGKGNEVSVYNSLYRTEMNGKRKKQVNQLKELIDIWDAEIKPSKKKKKKTKEMDTSEDYEIANPYTYSSPDQLGEGHLYHKLFKQQVGGEKPAMETDKKPKRQRRSKKIYSDKIVIFDDLSEELRDPYIASFLKKNRHYLATCIISSQHIDISPGSRSNIDILFAFKGISPGKVEILRRVADSSLDEKEFYNIYKEATNEPYSFLYANCRQNELYKRFDERLH